MPKPTVSRSQFHALFRGKMLLALTEAFAARTASRSETALIIDEHALHQKQLRDEIYDVLCGVEDRTAARECKGPATACARVSVDVRTAA